MSLSTRDSRPSRHENLELLNINSSKLIFSLNFTLLQADPHFFDSLFRLTEEENRWDTIASYKYYFEEKFDMLVGITKDAQLKQPWKASPGQYATQFLPLPYDIKKNSVEEMRLKDQQKKSTK